MAIGNHIRNPVEWIFDQFAGNGVAARPRPIPVGEAARPAVRHVEISELREVLARGFGDFGANRTDVLLLCLVYPLAGLVLARAASGYDLLPLVFPLVSGFALIGPVAGIGLYEMSRRRERGEPVNWATSFAVARSPAFGSIVSLALLLFAIFAAWLLAAWLIYVVTLGPETPTSVGAFASDVVTTAAGWAMIVLGIGVGFLFAVVALAVGVFSFPLLLDRNVGLGVAVETSARAVVANPRTMAAWGLIVAGGLVLGSLPLLAGLIVVLPVLGHATWHLYREVVGD